MSTFALSALARRRTAAARLASWSELSPALLLALVGIELAGRGAQFPHHVQWTSAEPVPAVAAIYENLLKSDNWELMLQEEASPSYRIRLARLGPGGFMTHWAMLDVSPREDRSRISLDFMITQGLTVTLN